MLAFAFYFFYVHLTLLITYDLVPPTRASQYFRNQLQEAPVRIPHRRRLFALNANFEMRFTYPRNSFVARRESYSRDRRGPATALECSSGLGSALGSAYRSHAANSRETKRNRTFNIAFTCGTAAGPACRSPTYTYLYATQCTHAPVNTRRAGAAITCAALCTRYRPRCTRDTCGSEVRTSKVVTRWCFSLMPMHLSLYNGSPLCTHATIDARSVFLQRTFA